MTIRFFIFVFLLNANFIFAEQQTHNIDYNTKIKDSKVIVKDIKVRGCSESKQRLVKIALKINPGDIINLQSAAINNNIKNVLESCSFVQDIQCSYQMLDEHNVCIIFTVQKAPLVIDFEFDNIDDNELIDLCKKDCFIKGCNAVYLDKLKQRLSRYSKKKYSEEYKIFVQENNEEIHGDKNIIIRKVDVMKQKSLSEILTYLALLKESSLKRMFKKNYNRVKKAVDDFWKEKTNLVLRSDGCSISDEMVMSVVEDKQTLQWMRSRSFLKIVISKQSSQKTEAIIEKLSFVGNKLLKRKQILKELNFSPNKTCFKSIVALVKNLKIQNLWRDISSLFKTYFLNKKKTETVDSYKNKIIDLYRRCGFVNAKIPKIEIIKDEKSKHIRVKYHIDEGKRFFVESIKIEGNKTLQDLSLLSLIKLKKGDIFNIQQLHDSIRGTAENMMLDGIKGLYNNYGFLNCDITIKTKYVDNKVYITIKIKEGDKSKVGIIRFYGNKYTDENYFKSYVLLLPSDDFTISKLAMSQQGLMQSEFINKEKTLLNPVKNEYLDEVQDIDCNIRELVRPQITGNASCDSDVDGRPGMKIYFIGRYNNLNLNKLLHLTNPKVNWLGKRHLLDLNISVMPDIEMQELKKHSYNVSLAVSFPEVFKILRKYVGFSCNFSTNQYFSHFNDDDDDWEKDDATKEIIRNVSFNTLFTWTNFNRKINISCGLLNFDYKWNKNGTKDFLDIPISGGFRYSNIDRSFFVTRGIDFYISTSFVNPLLAIFDLDLLKKDIKIIWYMGVYFPISKNIVFSLAPYLGCIKSFSDVRPSYFKLDSGILDTYMSQIQYTEFFLKCIDSTNFNLRFINKQKHSIVGKLNLELRRKIVEQPYFGFYLFGFANGGFLACPQVKIFSSGLFGEKFFGAAGLGIKLNIPIIGVIGWAFGWDLKTKKPNISFTLRHDFETIS